MSDPTDAKACELRPRPASVSPPRKRMGAKISRPCAVMPVFVTGIHVEISLDGVRIEHRVPTGMAGTGPGHDGKGDLEPPEGLNSAPMRENGDDENQFCLIAL